MTNHPDDNRRRSPPELLVVALRMSPVFLELQQHSNNKSPLDT
jgi:hypothetical protein